MSDKRLSEEEKKRKKSEYDRARRVANIDRARELARLSYERNKEEIAKRRAIKYSTDCEYKKKVLDKSKKWKESNKEKESNRAAEWRAKNPEKVKASMLKWCEKNIEKKRESARKWCALNRERINERIREDRKRRPEIYRGYTHSRRVRISGGKLSHGLCEKLLILQNHKCPCCSKKLANYHIDHIYPLALGGKHEDQNIQLLCPSCNRRKSSIDPIEFMQRIGKLL